MNQNLSINDYKELIISKLYKILYVQNINFWSIVKITLASSFSIYFLSKIIKYFTKQKKQIIDNTVKGILLKNGRFLSYEEFGDLSSSKIIIFFHSLGSCRKEKHPNEEILKKFGIKMINIDRPGYGKSEIDENRNYVSFSNDVIELLDCLKIEYFSICAVNSGCPYALSLCNKYKERVISCALLSPELPYSNLPHDEFSSHLKDTWFLTK